MKDEKKNISPEEKERFEKDEKRKEKITPIIDGDARPDVNLFPEDNVLREKEIETPEDQDQSKTTPYRADTDSIEDFKDAK